MIDFACKRIEFDEIIKCGLNLSKTEVSIFKYFIYDKPNQQLSSTEISNDLNLDLSTIQRTLKKLYEKNIVEKYQMNLDKGGYVFVYKIKSRQHIKEVFYQNLDNFTKKVKKEIDSW